MKRFATYIFLLFGLVALWVGCTTPEEEVWQPEKEKENIPIRFNLNLSEQLARAMDESDEEHIETIDILAFLKEGADYRYNYRREGNNYNSVSKNFTVDLISYSNEQVLVVLINARNELAAANILISDNVENALGKIVAESANEWPAKNNGGGASDVRSIPMVGISGTTVITQGMTEFPSTISLIRMLARVNIKMAEGINNFVLKTAQIYNRVTKGYVGYKPDEWNSGIAWVPVDGNVKPYKTYLPSFVYQAEGTGNESNITNQIYILESKGVTLSDYLESTAMVVGGTYMDSGVEKTCYYRIDLTPNGRLGNTAIDIVRTHTYDIEIQHVSYPGAATANDAYEGVVTLTAVVSDWKTNNGNTIFDGQNYLKLSHTTLSIATIRNSVTIIAETNYNANPYIGYPEGIVLDKEGMEDWCTADISGGEVGTSGIYRYEIMVDILSDFPESNPGEWEDRWTRFYIKAGNMNYRMAVYQWKGDWISTDVQASYQPGGTRHSIKLETYIREWEVSEVKDPDGILVNGDALKGQSGVGSDRIYFYIKSTAASGKTATLTITNRNGINPPFDININTP